MLFKVNEKASTLERAGSNWNPKELERSAKRQMIPDFIGQALATYHADWRNPLLASLEFSYLYSLHPEEPTTIPANTAWPDPWPCRGRPGVYFVFGAEMQLLYIGKTFDFGWRLSQHFRWSEGRAKKGICKERGTWKTRPMFVAPLPVNKAFEAPSLEEYLIEVLDPPENFVGKRRKRDALLEEDLNRAPLIQSDTFPQVESVIAGGAREL